MFGTLSTHRAVALTGFAGLLAFACGDPKPSLAESLAQQNEEQLPPGYTPNPKPRPKGLEPPTDAEFKAWNRKDPEGEKHLYKWDKAHLEEILGYWEDLECFREKVKEEGEKAFGAEPGTPKEEQWHQFKLFYVHHVNGWQQRIFSELPNIKENSKFLGYLLEAHEIVMHHYPQAYNLGDRLSLKEQDIRWEMDISQKMSKYVKALGGEWPERDPENAKQMAQHAKHCEEALKPPDRSGKVKRAKRRKGAI